MSSPFNWNTNSPQFEESAPRIPSANPPMPVFATPINNAPPTQRPVAKQPVVQQPEYQPEPIFETEEDEDVYNSQILTDANLRLELGSLYQVLMSHAIFDGYNANPAAIKKVEQEIKKFARERMEIMLGMRQEIKVQHSPGQFTELEVSILKALVSKGTQGKSESQEVNRVAGPQKLNTISSPVKQSLAPLQPPKAAAKPVAQATVVIPPEPIQEEPEENFGPRKKSKLLQDMDDNERAEHFRKNAEKYKTVKSSDGLPMPSGATEHMQYASMAAGLSRTLQPNEQSLMALINRDK